MLPYIVMQRMSIIFSLKKEAAQALESQSDETMAENVLCRLTACTTKHSICGIGHYNTQKLKNHMKSKHMKMSSHQYTVCNRYSGESQSPKVYRKKQVKGGYSSNRISVTRRGHSLHLHKRLQYTMCHMPIM